MDSVKKLLKMMRKRLPDAEWLVELLALWKPADEIFQKNYVYVRPRPATAMTVDLDNSDGFFENLPRLSAKEIKMTRRMRVPKRIRVKAALKALEARQ